MAEAFVAADGAAGRAAARGARRRRGGGRRRARPAVGGARRRRAATVAPPVDLRVEDHPEPLAELRRLLVLRRAYTAAGAADEAMAEGRMDEAARAVRGGRRAWRRRAPSCSFWAGLAQVQRGDARRRASSACARAIAANPGLGDAARAAGPRRRAGRGRRARRAVAARRPPGGRALPARTRRPARGVRRRADRRRREPRGDHRPRRGRRAACPSPTSTSTSSARRSSRSATAGRRGEMTIADEHLATGISYDVMRLISRTATRYPRRSRERVLLAAVGGEGHVTGLRMIGDLAEGARLRRPLPRRGAAGRDARRHRRQARARDRRPVGDDGRPGVRGSAPRSRRCSPPATRRAASSSAAAPSPSALRDGRARALRRRRARGDRDHRGAGRAGLAERRAPTGRPAGAWGTARPGSQRSSAVSTIRDCSSTWAAG